MIFDLKMIKKAFLKRLKITKNKKILRRICGVNHNLAKKRSKDILQKRKLREWFQLDFDKLKS